MTPVSSARPPSQRLALAWAHLIGWRVDVAEAPPQRCVIVGAHHTTAWDLPLTILLMLASNTRFRWVAKDSLFRGAAGWLFRRLGGMPVNRAARSNFVGHVVQLLQTSDTLRIAMLPEGTRRKAPSWRTGFYYIALGAGVPIVLGYADYRRKVVGLGPTLMPSGDIEADFTIMRAFYARVVGKYPERQSEIRVAPPAGA